MVVYILLLYLSALLQVTLSGKHDIYNGYTVEAVVIEEYDDVTKLQHLEAELDLDVWHYGSVGRRHAHVMVSKENKQTFLWKLDLYGLQHYVYIADVVTALEQHEEDIIARKISRNGEAVPYNDYPRFAQVNEYLERIATDYPNIATLVDAGNSFEGRPIKYLKISTTNFMDPSKPIYFMDAAIHAREWVTPPVALYTIHRLVEDLRDSERDLLDIDWIIFPLVNPDGYEYSHTDERLWRRTRSYRPEINETCYGVDGNRNFDVNFNTVGVSPDHCSNTYPGPEAFSEPETGYVRDVLLEYIDRIQIFLDIHSYGNYVLYGFGNASLPTNAVSLHHVGASMGAVIDSKKLSKATYYLVGNSNLVLYQSSGSAQDYGQAVGVPFSYTLELPGYEYGFLVPPDYIEQINIETWPGIVDSARLAKLFYNARNQN
ncbi:carboxypeptidase B-like [Leptidea sinapis]|uniref:carboxypeptidase B-like n=1 Tax=Leptidea sinapis TaxID=189913 RepID=UPI0021413679|nr:carboxypeptidase B-like [Leptidea sinapis]